MSAGTLHNSLSTAQTAAATPASYFYRAVWRWHFYAGLFVMPVLVTLAISGLIFLFKPQLDQWTHGQYTTVRPGQTRRPYSEQLDVVRQVYPDCRILAFRPNPGPTRSTEVRLITKYGRHLTVFVHPAIGHVLGERDEDRLLSNIALKVHRELMMGELGDRIIELAACWGLVLLITGLYLWWPRQRFMIWGTLLPRLSLKNKRLFWRDLHAVPGVWGALLIGIMLITGLTRTGYWGQQVMRLESFYPAQLHRSVPKSTMPQHPERLVQANAETSTPGAAPTASAVDAPIDLDTVIAIARASGARPGLTVSLPAGPEDVYTISGFVSDPANLVTLHIDQYSGEVLADVRWKDYSPVSKAVELGSAFHAGRYFGFWNQVVGVIACLLVVGLSVTGVIMWWRRRRPGRLGAPAMPPNFPMWKGAVTIIASMCLLFPLIGYSLIVVLVLDWLIVPRIPLLQRVLS
jgi:uncharacterized iron-regulated membrane protein